jgi:hypothetical protein
MPLFALVDMAPNPENLFRVENLENRNSAPPMLNGYRWLKDDEFAPGAVAGIGLYWDGVLPATFIEKPVLEPDPAGPTTQSEAIAAAEAKIAEATALLTQARALG